jgi:hypothetical protein
VTDALSLVVAAASAALAPPVASVTAAPTAPVAAPVVLEHAISLAIPSTDGGRGALVIYERYAPDRRISFGATGELRETAIGDYTGVRVGVGGRVRYFPRHTAWLSKQPKASMVGWFVGGGVHVDTDFTHANTDHRWLAPALELGGSVQVGYRIAPWRGLVITPTTGIAIHHTFDLSGRLAGLTLGGGTVGLELGWLY